MFNLISMRIEISDTEDVLEHMYQEGWSDGLPVVPPTEENVLGFLKEAGVAPARL